MWPYLHINVSSQASNEQRLNNFGNKFINDAHWRGREQKQHNNLSILSFIIFAFFRISNEFLYPTNYTYQRR